VHVPVSAQRSRICHSAYPQQVAEVKKTHCQRFHETDILFSLFCCKKILIFLADYFFLTESTDYFIFFDPIGKIYAASLTDPSRKEVLIFNVISIRFSSSLCKEPALPKAPFKVVPARTQTKKITLTQLAKPLDHSQSSELNVSVKQPILDNDIQMSIACIQLCFGKCPGP